MLLAQFHQAIAATPPGYRQSAPIVIPGATVRVFYGPRTVYTFDASKGLSDGCLKPPGSRLRLKVTSTAPLAVQQFVKAGGKTHEITYRSSNPSVAGLFVHETADVVFIELQGISGRTDIVVTISGRSIAVPLDVKTLPICPWMSGADVIRRLGFPDRRDRIQVRWPNTLVRNGVEYSPPLGDPDIWEHWVYRRFPNAVLAFNQVSLQMIYTQGWGIFYGRGY
jgi:hypothetical protein